MSNAPSDNPTARRADKPGMVPTEEEMRGTDKLPMPDDSPVVAGQPRDGRVLTEPGDPGIITPEDDALVNPPARESRP